MAFPSIQVHLICVSDFLLGRFLSRFVLFSGLGFRSTGRFATATRLNLDGLLSILYLAEILFKKREVGGDGVIMTDERDELFRVVLSEKLHELVGKESDVEVRD